MSSITQVFALQNAYKNYLHAYHGWETADSEKSNHNVRIFKLLQKHK